MKEVHRITVSLGTRCSEEVHSESAIFATADRSYAIGIGRDWLSELPLHLPSDLHQIEHVACICDEGVMTTWGKVVADSFRSSNRRVDAIDVPSGEKAKSVEQLQRLWEWLLSVRADRQTLIVAVGGGVIGDLAGMVAATYARGLRFVQVPTTLLAQVDSSVGGKTGINLSKAKNMVGAFWQPRFVAIDTETLKTLPQRETTSGWAEIVKYGVILDAGFFEYLENNVQLIAAGDDQVLALAIKRSCELKGEVVSRDEREVTGLRAILNYGHTFAHAIEATVGYGAYLHGEAVAIGMQMAARLAERLGRVSREFSVRQETLLQKLHLPTTLPDPDPHALIQAMASDKKVAYGKLRFILPKRLGAVELVADIDPQLVHEAILDCSTRIG